jgi:hypothetical protein
LILTQKCCILIKTWSKLIGEIYQFL